MNTPNIATDYKLYAFDEANPLPIEVSKNYHRHTITVQPLDLLPEDLDKPLYGFLNESNAVPRASVTGAVTLESSPPANYEKYALPDGVIDLANPTFLTTDSPISRLHLTISTPITGCTHLVVVVTSYP